MTPVEPASEAEVGRISGYAFDWNGASMADGEEPRVVPTCGELRALIARIRAQDEEIARLKKMVRAKALAELARLDGETM